jgi:uncharacterized protein YfbU (UPF0304 family)
VDKYQKLVLINQYKILSLLEPSEKAEYDKRIDALVSGYTLNQEWHNDWIGDDRPIEDCRFVLDVLDMFDRIKFSIEERKIAGIPNAYRTEFRGFDGNDGFECWCMGYARYLFEREDRFTRLIGSKKFDFNSHMPLADRYRSMLAKYKKYNLAESPDYCLSKDQIEEIISD